MSMQTWLNDHVGGPAVVNVFCVLGLLRLLSILWYWLRTFQRQVLRPCCQGKRHTYSKYGVVNDKEKSWAVVTGGSDGIGLAMCKKLAKEGFNICIASRTETKINEKLEEIRKECRPGDATFKTLCLVVDFSQIFTLDEYHKTIAEKLENLDVAVLVLNAGLAPAGKGKGLPGAVPQDLQNLCQVNLNHVLYTAKVMLNQLRDRLNKKGKRSAIVVVSSVAAQVPHGVYSSTKAFASYLAQSLNFEMRDTIDVMSYDPCGVNTKIIPDHMKGNPMLQLISAERAADVCFRDLGHMQVTFGAFGHEFIAWLMGSVIPARTMQAMTLKARKKQMAKEAEKKD